MTPHPLTAANGGGVLLLHLSFSDLNERKERRPVVSVLRMEWTLQRLVFNDPSRLSILLFQSPFRNIDC